jgi:hypothetical protein
MIRSVLGDAVAMARLTRDLRGFLRAPISEGDARDALQHRLRHRNERFLDLVERTVFNHPSSPYLALLRNAGCEWGDLEGAVVRDGVDGALTQLLDAGVYVTFDEFKGRAEAVRGSRRFSFAQADFDNPLVTPHLEIRSGGTRGTAAVVKVGLDFVADQAVNTAVALSAHDLGRHEHAYWVLSNAMTLSLRIAKLGRAPAAWFYPLRPLSLKLRLASSYLAGLGRLLGSRLPAPRYLDLRDPARMAEWLSARAEAGRLTCLTTNSSSAVRVCSAAAARGLSLAGTCFVAMGEPVTLVKREQAELVGARLVVHYGFTEGGMIGYSCRNPRAPDDVHLFPDAHALVQRRREVAGTGVEVPAFALTSLLRSAPKVLLNAEIGDYGVAERRSCDCELGRLGLDTHLASIRSFEKLSGEGVTFARAPLLAVLEEVLPPTFGGAATDYQLIEEEGDDGIQRLALIVSPVVGAIDEADLRRVFLAELGRDGGAARIGSEMWRRAQTLHVQRREPLATGAGKILPFHLVRRADGRAQR